MQVYPFKALRKFIVCKNLDICLSSIEQNSKLAVAISRKHALNSHSISSIKISCFEDSEIIYEYPLKFLTTKNFSYLNELNKFILMASSSGFINKWIKDQQISTYFHSESQEKYYNQITIEHFYGCLIILGCILIGIILILTLEIFIHKQTRKPNSSKYWKIIEMFIDPKRHFWLENKWT